MNIKYLPALLFICLLAACRPSPQYQEHVNVPGNAWNNSFKPEFHFAIEDTASAYQLFFIIRHTEAYPFNNIWLMMDNKNPGDTTYHSMRVEIPLAAASGQWLGRGMGEIWEQRVAINSASNPAYFKRKGNYTIRLSQDMRRNPLPEVMQVGLRIEKLGVLQQRR